MTRHQSLRMGLAIALSGSLFLPGCGGILRQAVVDGAYTYVSGGLSQGLTSGGIQNTLQDLLGNLLFQGADTNTSTTDASTS